MSILDRILGVRYFCKAIRNSSLKRVDFTTEHITCKLTNQNLELL